MTLGVVQSFIKEGMSQADIASALGSPNIVTQDKDGNDTWIYDKIATETSQSGSSQGDRDRDRVLRQLRHFLWAYLAQSPASVKADRNALQAVLARNLKRNEPSRSS